MNYNKKQNLDYETTVSLGSYGDFWFIWKFPRIKRVPLVICISYSRGIYVAKYVNTWKNLSSPAQPRWDEYKSEWGDGGGSCTIIPIEDL